MTFFESAEQLERELTTRLFKQANITDYHFSEVGSMSTNDGYFTDEEGIKNWFEVKVRRFPQGTYTGYMMEKEKFAQLLPLYKAGGNIWYINFFIEEDETYSAIIFDLSSWCFDIKTKGLNINSYFFPILTRSTTAANTGYHTKEVTMLTPSSHDKIVTKLN